MAGTGAPRRAGSGRGVRGEWTRGGGRAPGGRAPGGRAPGGRRRGRIALLVARLSATTRILLAYLALGTAVVVVVGVGAALQPSYGTEAPWLGLRVDDVRAAPTTSAWTVDLAGTLAPGAPPECLRFTALDVGRNLAVVRAESAANFGFSDDPVCSIVPGGYRSRLGLLDTSDGVFLWEHDVAPDLVSKQGVAASEAVAIDWTSVVSQGTKILVRAGTDDQSVVETLSAQTGDLVDTTGVLPWGDLDRFTASSHVVAVGHFSNDELEYDYDLRDVDDLSHIVWSGPANPSATMIALSDRLLLGTDATEQIPLETGVAAPWGPAIDTSLGYAVHDDVVYAARTTGSGVTTVPAPGFEAIDRTGTVLWRSPLTLRGSFSITRSCLAVSNGGEDRLACLDYSTGKTLWSDAVGPFSSAGSVEGQTSDDVYVVSSPDSTSVSALDGRSGKVRFHVTVPTGATVSAAGRTVGYVLSYGISGSKSTVMAFDLSSGSRLWSHAAQQQLVVWGGRLLDIGVDGMARLLT